MEFYNRANEIERIRKALNNDSSRLIVVYGRRRCGKSTLIKKVLRSVDIYFMAQQSDEAILLNQMAKAIGEKIPGFDTVIYPDWESLFSNLDKNLQTRVTICIDEFPYLAKSSPQLPSVLQKIIDNGKQRKYHIILCGSSQQMMHGLVLDSSSPLYGRAHEILKVLPLKAGWLQDALGCTFEETVEEYSVWGGVPRYWELRREEGSFELAIKNIILDRLGILHEEPTRLFLDDMRESVQAFSILSIVGKGVNRLSEIAGRLNKPTTHISRPIDNLIKLGYLKREIPFGVSPKSNKRSLYRISDQLINFYFTFVTPNLSRLELDMKVQVFSGLKDSLSQFVSNEWENLCRSSVPVQPIKGIDFDVPSRWWGNNIYGQKMELDVVGESLDKKYLLVGECKWSKLSHPEKIIHSLKKKALTLPFAQNKTIIPTVFVKGLQSYQDMSPEILTPSEVLKRLR